MSDNDKKYCFMHTQEVECVPRCKAYRFRGETEKVGTCAILDVADTFVGAVVGWVSMQQAMQESSVRHGDSAPPPEVK